MLFSNPGQQDQLIKKLIYTQDQLKIHCRWRTIVFIIQYG